MFFASKSKGFCVEMGEQTTLLARFVQSDDGCVVEELKELPSTDVTGLVEWIKASEGKGATGLAQAICGVYPAKRIIRRQTLDLKRVKEPTYFNEIYTQQFRIEPDKYALKTLNYNDGGSYEIIKASQKEVIFCGLPMDEVESTQSKFLSQGIYPERLELGTLATLGGIVSYLKFKQSKSSVLILEMGDEATQSYIVSQDGVDISRSIPTGIASMIPVVQKELGLKDQESALKLFYSNTFDFTSMGGTLVKKLLKDLQSLIGFYEVQTGQSIVQVFCTQLPNSLSWIAATMAGALGVPQLKIDVMPWLESQHIKLAESVSPNPPDARWTGLFSLLASHEKAVAQGKSKDEPDVELRWHADFRDTTRLPDTKVVRTTFFVNTAAIAITLALLMWTGYREFHIHSLGDQIAEAQQQIDSNSKQNKEALRLSQVFATEEKKLVEAENFVRAPMSPSEFIDLLAGTLPREISIEAVEIRLADPKNAIFVLRGLVAGSRDQASGSASSYVEKLHSNARLHAVFDPISLDRLTPDGSTGMLAFEISLKVKTEGKK